MTFVVTLAARVRAAGMQVLGTSSLSFPHILLEGQREESVHLCRENVNLLRRRSPMHQPQNYMTM